jgi:hypothetical protein
MRLTQCSGASASPLPLVLWSVPPTIRLSTQGQAISGSPIEALRKRVGWHFSRPWEDGSAAWLGAARGRSARPMSPPEPEAHQGSQLSGENVSAWAIKRRANIFSRRELQTPPAARARRIIASRLRRSSIACAFCPPFRHFQSGFVESPPKHFQGIGIITRILQKKLVHRRCPKISQ